MPYQKTDNELLYDALQEWRTVHENDNTPLGELRVNDLSWILMRAAQLAKEQKVISIDKVEIL